MLRDRSGGKTTFPQVGFHQLMVGPGRDRRAEELPKLVATT